MPDFQETLPQTADEVVQPTLTDVQNALNAVDNVNSPNVFLVVSWLNAIPTAVANRIFDYYLQLARVIRLNMPDTTEGEPLDRWGAIYIGPRTSAVGATGNVIATGTPASVIPALSKYQSTNGLSYTVTANATITAQVLDVDSITRVGTTATVTTTLDHNLASNVLVTIAGAVEVDYNITDAVIQVTGLKTFTYTVANAPATPATGTITTAFDAASVSIEGTSSTDPDVEFGASTNQLLDAPLNLQVIIPGVDTIANVDFSQLTGGLDEEADDAYKQRMLGKIQNPVSHYATSDIEQQILAEVSGVTRVFIQKSGQQLGTISVTSINRTVDLATVVTAVDHGLSTGFEVTITGAVEVDYNVTDALIFVIDATTFIYSVANTPSTPATGTILSSGAISLGRVQIRFARDNDDDGPIPDADEVADVKTAVLAITPANTPDVYVLVDPPVALPIAFTFTALFPDSTSMRTAITAQLQQFFDEQVSIGVDVEEDAFRSSIFTTIDTETGFTVESFTLSTPTADIAVDFDELPTLGTITYP